MSVQWNPPESQFLGKLLSYNVLYGVKDLSERTVFSLIGLSAFLSNLEEFSEYEIEIRGVYTNDVQGLGLITTAVTDQTGKELCQV